jgi:AraC family transcriptional regulator
MTSRLTDCATVDMSALVKTLALLSPTQLSRWQGLPVHCLDTPEGVWNHSFTPASTVVSLLDEGSITAHINVVRRGMESDFRAGSLALFNANMEVRAHQRGSRDARRIVVDVDSGSLAHRDLFDDDLVSTPLRDGCEFGDPSLAAVLREMVREIRNGCPNGTLFAESLSVGVLLHLCRTRGTRPVPAARESGKLTVAEWSRVNELIASELDSDLSLSALSGSLGLSKPHFVRLFRRTAGTSPHRYVMQKRVERAHDLILASDVPLVEVASEAGFASQSHLNRMFQKAYGITPGVARRHSGHRARTPAGSDESGQPPLPGAKPRPNLLR